MSVQSVIALSNHYIQCHSCGCVFHGPSVWGIALYPARFISTGSSNEIDMEATTDQGKRLKPSLINENNNLYNNHHANI